MAQEKLLPQNLEAETGVLGSLLIDPEAIAQVRDWLMSDDFYREAHRTIYQAIIDLWDAGTPADLITLTDELGRRGKLEELGGISYVSALANQVPTSANVEYYGHIVERTGVLRRLIHAAGQIAAVAYNEPDAPAALEQAEKLVFEVGARWRSGGALHSLGEGLREVFDRLGAAKDGTMSGLSTGFKKEDDLLGGHGKTDLIIVAARPAVGKSAYMLNKAYNAARKGHGVLIYSLEMGIEQLVVRLLAMEARVDQTKLRTGQYLSDAEWERISEALASMSGLLMWIDDTPGLSISELRTRTRRALMEHPEVDMICVDYLQLMQGTGKAGRDGNRVQEVSEISRGLKLLAKELCIPVVALSQLSREVEKRTDKHPQLSDLRDSGTLEQDADVVEFIYRDEVYNPESDRPNIADITVAKHRHGATGQFSLFFEREFGIMRDLALGPAPTSVGASSYGEERDEREDW